MLKTKLAALLGLIFISTLSGCFLSKHRADAAAAVPGTGAGSGGDGENTDPATPVVAANGDVTLKVTDAVLSSAALALSAGSTQINMVSSTSAQQCGTPGSVSFSPPMASTGNAALAQSFQITYTAPRSEILSKVTLKVGRLGASPAGYSSLIVFGGSGVHGSGPALSSGIIYGPATQTLATSASGGQYIDYILNSDLTLTAHTKYHFLVYGANGAPFTYSATDGEGFQIGYMTTGECANATFGTFYYHLGDSTYGAVAGPPQMQVWSSGYSADSPTATYTIDATKSVIWDLSTFTSTENANGEAGSITYEIGVSDDGIATYTYGDATKADVVNLGTLTGRYLHIRAHFLSTGLQDANLGEIGVHYTP